MKYLLCLMLIGLAACSKAEPKMEYTATCMSLFGPLQIKSSAVNKFVIKDGLLFVENKDGEQLFASMANCTVTGERAE